MPPKVWLIAVGLVPVWWLFGVIALAAISLATQGECYDPATPAGLHWARALLAINAVVVLVPWIVVAARLRASALVALGLVASGVTLYWAVAVWTMGPAQWTNYNIC